MTRFLFIHPKVNDVASFLEYTCLNGHINGETLEWDPVHPSILIATEWIYYRKDLFTSFRKLYPSATLKIAWMGEAVSADLNIFDYWVGFDAHRETDPRFVRILSPLDMYHRFIPTRENDIKDTATAGKCLESKSGFCNFLYSNGHAHPMREQLFHALSGYRRVDSIGKYLNNVGTPGTGYGGHAHECIALKSPYRFSIAAENASYYGYTSEKIITSLIAHTVPIYWGNPAVADDINPECFINARDYGSLEDIVDKVREIDNDPEAWAEMVARPWFTPEQAEAHIRRTERYCSAMAYLLSGNAPQMVPEGYHVDLYRAHFFSGKYAFDRSLLEKAASRLSIKK